jgi:hypothetical protein
MKLNRSVVVLFLLGIAFLIVTLYCLPATDLHSGEGRHRGVEWHGCWSRS